MRWLIKNPAPSDFRREKWGDFHFGRSLTKYLERRGHSVETHFDPHWDAEADADVVLVLRGRHSCDVVDRHEGAVWVMWNISHPGDVSMAEYATYDLVCVASRPWARELDEVLQVPVRPLLQCTDLEEFHPGAGGEQPRQGLVFVGNTRDSDRSAVRWALDYGVPLQIWGRGWATMGVPGDNVVGDYYPNERLGALYATSRATLNDHWPDMKQHGFVNNRVLDALACHLPVVSDWHEELQDLIPSGVLTYRDRWDFEQCMQELLLDYPRIQDTVSETAERIRSDFSFERRTDQLLDLVSALMAGGRVGHASRMGESGSLGTSTPGRGQL